MLSKLKSSLHEHRRCLLFIDARGGTGRTHLLNALLALARLSDNSCVSPALAVATSGIAAIQLHGGRTFHSHFKALTCLSEETVLNIPVQSSLASLIPLCKLVVWDEDKMVHHSLLEALDRSLRDIMNVELPFGGNSLIIAGDFRFVCRSLCLSLHSVFFQANPSHSSWSLFQQFQLTENVRLSSCTGEIAAHCDGWLLDVGNGRAPNDKTVVRLSDKVHLSRRETRHSDMLSCIYWL